MASKWKEVKVAQKDRKWWENKSGSRAINVEKIGNAWYVNVFTMKDGMSDELLSRGVQPSHKDALAIAKKFRKVF